MPAVWQPLFHSRPDADSHYQTRPDSVPIPYRSRNLVPLSVSWHLINLATTWAWTAAKAIRAKSSRETMPPMYVALYLIWPVGRSVFLQIPILGAYIEGPTELVREHFSLIDSAAISWKLCAFVLRCRNKQIRWNINKVADTPKYINILCVPHRCRYV